MTNDDLLTDRDKKYIGSLKGNFAGGMEMDKGKLRLVVIGTKEHLRTKKGILI